MEAINTSTIAHRVAWLSFPHVWGLPCKGGLTPFGGKILDQGSRGPGGVPSSAARGKSLRPAPKEKKSFPHQRGVLCRGGLTAFGGNPCVPSTNGLVHHFVLSYFLYMCFGSSQLWVVVVVKDAGATASALAGGAPRTRPVPNPWNISLAGRGSDVGRSCRLPV